jgi:hypothetical protein
VDQPGKPTADPSKRPPTTGKPSDDPTTPPTTTKPPTTHPTTPPTTTKPPAPGLATLQTAAGLIVGTVGSTVGELTKATQYCQSELAR